MRSHKILEHTADIRLKVEGDTLEELFKAAVEGMAEIISPSTTPNSPGEIVEITSKNRTTLLIDLLSEVLTKSHINRTVYTQIKFNKLEEDHLEAIIKGSKVEEFDEDIKAVTYHEADIQKNAAGNYETVIVFDI